MRGRASRCREGLAFAAAARSYWLEAFPQVRRERERWRRLALSIPDPILRRDALSTLEEKWGHSEGAAAFAVLAPRAGRDSFVRMVVAYQLMVDYLDTISERTVSDPWANTVQLHRAAQNSLAAPLAREPDYYLFNPSRNDGGFLTAQLRECREIFLALPSAPLVAGRVERLTGLYAESQGHCHAEQARPGSSDPTVRIDAAAARHPELRWGEVLASCNTSVPVFAMMAQASWPGRSEAEVERCYSAYFPWAASLHILLHSMVDETFDLATGKFNQLGHYGTKPEAAEALASIALRARERLAALPQAEIHLALLAAMCGYYLASPAAWQDENPSIAEPVLEAIGPAARWSMAAHRLRRALGGA